MVVVFPSCVLVMVSVGHGFLCCGALPATVAIPFIHLGCDLQADTREMEPLNGAMAAFAKYPSSDVVFSTAVAIF